MENILTKATNWTLLLLDNTVMCVILAPNTFPAKNVSGIGWFLDPPLSIYDAQHSVIISKKRTYRNKPCKIVTTENKM